MITGILLTTLLTVPILFAINEVSSLMVYKWYLGEDFLDEYMPLWLDEAQLNIFNEKILSTGGSGFITTHNSLISKWYVHDFGQIPRWSKWSRVIDEKHNELLLNGEFKSKQQVELERLNAKRENFN